MLVLHPADSIKTRLQSGTAFDWGILDLTTIYAGLLSSLMASFPCAAIFFLAYDLTKIIASKISFIPTPVAHILAASIAESVQAIVRNPFEVVKLNM